MSEFEFAIAERSEFIYHYFLQRLKHWHLDTSVRFSMTPWPELWDSARNAAFQHKGFETAEIGSTWLGSLAKMNVLRPFEPSELKQFGRSDTFLPAAWASTMLNGDQHIWGIPWMGDTRVIYFWRDMLEACNIDCDTAFQTPEQMEETFRRLQAGGIENPWITMTSCVNNTVHNLVPWLCQAGGDFLSPNRKSTAFAESNALRGIEAYFRLRRYMVPCVSMSEMDAIYRFSRREAAVTINGPWLLTRLRDAYENPNGTANLGLTLPPGPAFVGGSHLIIFRHISASHERSAVNLISQLTSRQSQMELGTMLGMLPVRLDVMDDPVYANDPDYRVMIAAMRGGYSLPAVPRWGLVEESLRDAFYQIWQTIETNPKQSVGDIVAGQMEALAHHLDGILAA